MISIYQFVDKMIAKGYTTIPGYINRDGETIPQSFGKGEIYPSDIIIERNGRKFNPWDNADFVGLRLDNMILIDYDGNKEEKPDVTPQQLAKQIGVTSLKESLVQWGVNETGGYNGSFHFLFLLPKILNRDYYKNSQDGKHFKGVDIKTGNQIMWIKSHKVFNFPDKMNLPHATSQMVEMLKIEDEDLNTKKGFVQKPNHSQRRGLAWLDEVCNRLAATGSGRNNEFNQMSLAAVRYAIANELPLALAEARLKEAASACKLPKSSIKATWNSAYRAALRKGPKNFEDNNYAR